MKRIGLLLIAALLAYVPIARAGSNAMLDSRSTAAAGGGGTVTAVTGANGLTSTGGATPAIALPACTAAQLVIENAGATLFACATLSGTDDLGTCSIGATGVLDCTVVGGSHLAATTVPITALAVGTAAQIPITNAGATADAYQSISGAGDLGTTTLGATGILNAQVTGGTHLTANTIPYSAHDKYTQAMVTTVAMAFAGGL